MKKLLKKSIAVIMVICLVLANLPAGFALFKNSGKKAIIIIPGINGSELFSAEDQMVDGTFYPKNYRFWPPECLTSLINPKNSSEVSPKPNLDFETIKKDLSLIACNPDGTSKVKIMPSNPILDCKNNPHKRSLGIINFYKSLVKSLSENIDNNEYDIVFFSYDFRRSNKDSAEELEKLINENNYESVSFIGHSMGCLVCASYLTKEENQNKTDKTILLGGPLLGSPKAYSVLDEGKFVDGIFGVLSSALVAPIIKYIVKDCPSVYELLPPKQYFDVEPEGYLSNGVDYLNPVKLKSYEETVEFINSRMISENSNKFLHKAQEFYNSLFKEGKFVLENSKLKVYNITGICQSTPFNIVVNKRSKLDVWPNKEIKQDGDGMVSVNSVLVGQALEGKDNYYLKQVPHTSLISHKASLELICNILKNNFKVSDKYDKIVQKTRPAEK